MVLPRVVQVVELQAADEPAAQRPDSERLRDPDQSVKPPPSALSKRKPGSQADERERGGDVYERRPPVPVVDAIEQRDDGWIESGVKSTRVTRGRVLIQRLPEEQRRGIRARGRRDGERGVPRAYQADQGDAYAEQHRHR